MLLSLRRNNGTTLEPSAGNGAISNAIQGCVSIEIDDRVISDSILMDFFDYPISNTYDTIIGNPPYVRYQDILESTLSKLDSTMFDKRTNLYMFFIHKCIQHLNPDGELIFLTPKTFFNATCCVALNEFIYNTGTITDVIDYGDTVVFNDATPNVIIWRFQKGLTDRSVKYNGEDKTFSVFNGRLTFTNGLYDTKFSDLFYVKVGGVSGADKIFTHDSGNTDLVCSYTVSNGQTKRMIYGAVNPHLLQYKDELISRKIRKFDDSNWSEWGRKCYISDDDRIYVNCKTRKKRPFFIHESKMFDGSVLGIFPLYEMDIVSVCDKLNEIDWEDLGFKVGGRFTFTQRTLSNTRIPNII